MDWKGQTCRDQELSFSPCFTVKGSVIRKAEVLQSKLGKNDSSQMWTPKTSVVVPPDLKIKGVCLPREQKRADTISASRVKASRERGDNEQKGDNSRTEDNLRDDKHDVNNGEKGNMLLAVLEASLKKKLNPEYIDILPWRLNCSTAFRSAQVDGVLKNQFRLYSRQFLKEERLPTELKFGVRNPRKSNSAAGTKRDEVLRAKTELNPYRGKLEPLLLREKPSKNLHEELEREEAREYTGT